MAPQARRRVGQDQRLWQSLRDDLYMLLMGPLGQAAPMLAEMEELCPMSGRTHELWQPLLAIASMADPDEKRGLVKNLIEYAISIVDAHQEDHFDPAHLAILQVLVWRRRKNETPTSKELLDRVQERPGHGQLYARWTPRKVSEVLGQYGIATTKTNKGRLYLTPMDYLKRIETSYAIDLDTDGRAQNAVVVRLL